MFYSIHDAVKAGLRVLENTVRQEIARNQVPDPLLDFSLGEKTSCSILGERIHLEIILRMKGMGCSTLE